MDDNGINMKTVQDLYKNSTSAIGEANLLHSNFIKVKIQRTSRRPSVAFIILTSTVRRYRNQKGHVEA